MTRAEAWLTGVGAALALAPGVLLIGYQLLTWIVVDEPAFGVGNDRGLEAVLFTLLLSVPGLYLVVALALPDRRAIRAVLVCAAALLLLLTSIAAYAVTLPAMIVVVAAAVLTARRLTAEDSRALWPAAAFIPVVVLLWLVAGALALDGVNDSCASTASQLGGPSVDCGELGAPEGAAILALVAAPAAFVAYLWRRSPQPTAEL